MVIERFVPSRDRTRPGRFVRRGAACLVALACGACAVGPDYHRPGIEAPEGWNATRDPHTSTDVPSRVVVGTIDDRRWWTVFHDPILDHLIETAMSQSFDIQEAALRISEARAQRDSAAGAYYPQVEATNVAARLRSGAGGLGQVLDNSSSSSSSTSSSSGGTSVSSSGFSTNLFQVGFDATWEPDIFGRTRRTVEAADAAIVSAEEQRRDAMVSVAAEIARDYMTLRGAERQQAINRSDIESQEHLQRLIDSRNKSGLIPTSDVTTQRVQVSIARARLPQVEQMIATNRNRLALLLAMPPGTLDQQLGEGALPGLPPEVPVDLPGELLRRRPDIRRREADLAQATAQVGVATAMLFPRVRFGAVGSVSSNRTSTLFDWASRFGLVGVDLSVPIFQGGQLLAQVRVADYQTQEAVVTYRQTVLNAFHDVDNAITTYALDQRRTIDLGKQLEGSRKGRALALDRYTSGLGAYIDVLNAEHQANQAELDLAQSAVTASTDLVALFKALGGGWEMSAPLADAAP